MAAPPSSPAIAVVLPRGQRRCEWSSAYRDLRIGQDIESGWENAYFFFRTVAAFCVCPCAHVVPRTRIDCSTGDRGFDPPEMLSAPHLKSLSNKEKCLFRFFRKQLFDLVVLHGKFGLVSAKLVVQF
jgi:hypothetical protein